MTTVGYGDMYAKTNAERVFCLGLMILGVSIFTYISGALTSIITVLDETDAVYEQKIMFLNKL
jgi:hypothetical protein